MNKQSQATTETDDAADYQPPPLRVFEVTYIDGTTRIFSAHFCDTKVGNLLLMDEVQVRQQRVLFYRHTIAAGQWREVGEVTSTQTAQVN